MTTTTPTLGRRHNVSDRHYVHAFDQLVAHLGISMLRWANNRNRRHASSHESQQTLRQLENGRAARELDAQRLASMRGF